MLYAEETTFTPLILEASAIPSFILLGSNERADILNKSVFKFSISLYESTYSALSLSIKLTRESKWFLSKSGITD